MPANPDDHGGDLDVEAVFAEIVSHWDEQADRRRSGSSPAPHDATVEDRPHPPLDEDPGHAGATPAGEAPGEGTTGPAGGAHPAPPESSSARPVPPLPPAPLEPAARDRPLPPPAHASRARHDDDEARAAARDEALLGEEGFVPPEPPPLPRDVITWLAWGGVLGGPAVLLIATLVRQRLSGIIAALAVAAFVAGFATLVARLPERRDDDDDDGAVV
ncbi:hypothetical protein CLV92_106102 [Kineococcus xinjiangensis]|uniref:Uncharacterized protein n=1 Tax=Kineococcus xinjiangensis TaxID=512762 RepID=A0A2S6IM79_9ACTN|nr:hypothetical protein [Kineococcus xinjiangensis]PPK95281.1 hypothetical protein CLV92_106102 [Kineococcus xinjiangensis]